MGMPLELIQTLYMQILADFSISHKGVYGYEDMKDHLETLFQIDILSREAALDKELRELGDYMLSIEGRIAIVTNTVGGEIGAI